ncbi:unnamed protein product, partial [Allacma fusca]
TGLVRQSFCTFAFLLFVVFYIEALAGPADQKNHRVLLCVVVSLLCCASQLIALNNLIYCTCQPGYPQGRYSNLSKQSLNLAEPWGVFRGGPP